MIKKSFLIFSFLCIFSSNVFANIFSDKEQARKAGDAIRMVPVLYAWGLTIYNDDFLEGTKELALSTLGAQASVEILKRVVQEKRPDYEMGDKKYSFPSGHAAGGFSGAFFVHKRYGFSQAIVPYTLATYISYSRVKGKKHHFHDVLAGALIAGAFTYFLVDEKTQVGATASSDGFMLSYRKSF